MTATLTDRYVHAATRWLPAGSRDEIARELRERIDDTVAARGPDSTETERAVLDEMGDPLRVMAEYSGRESRLIGPRYFYAWLRLLVILVAVIPLIAATVTVAIAVWNGEPAGSLIGSGIASWFQVAVQVAFWTTLVFAVLEWTNTETDLEVWTVDSLPDDTRDSVAEFVLQVLSLIALAGVLVWQATASPFGAAGTPLPWIDPDLEPWWLPLVLVLLVAEIAHAAWVYRAGWSAAQAWSNAAIAAVFAAVTIPLLVDGSLLNPDLVDHLGWDAGIVTTALRWTAVGVAVVTMWEIADGFVRAARGRVQ